jgi:hypothetical protein
MSKPTGFYWSKPTGFWGTSHGKDLFKPPAVAKKKPKKGK